MLIDLNKRIKNKLKSKINISESILKEARREQSLSNEKCRLNSKWCCARRTKNMLYFIQIK